MKPNDKNRQYYKALLEKNSNYEGVFYVGVKTTGVFCRPTCPARKPKFENCEFFDNAQQAFLAGFRPCERCHPLLNPDEESSLVKQLLMLLDERPEKRWKASDLRELSIDDSTARRQFKKRFGMTFIEYARAKRLGLAFKQIRGGDKVIDAQLSSGYESNSGFRDAFEKILGQVPARSKESHVLQATWIDTKLGPMIAMADHESLYLLEFVDRRGLEREVERLRKKGFAIVPGENAVLKSAREEINAYFDGKCFNFKTPIKLLGSDFQRSVWRALQKIPVGTTCSYQDLAKSLGLPKAYRAVANANGANQIAIIIPCHRVINADGKLGGYGGGISRKDWLLSHEENI